MKSPLFSHGIPTRRAKKSRSGEGGCGGVAFSGSGPASHPTPTPADELAVFSSPGAAPSSSSSNVAAAQRLGEGTGVEDCPGIWTRYLETGYGFGSSGSGDGSGGGGGGGPGDGDGYGYGYGFGDGFGDGFGGGDGDGDGDGDTNLAEMEQLSIA